MKKVREWFNELPEPIRGMAFECMNKVEAEKVYSTLKKAVIFGTIDWGKTKQGDKFWDFVCEGEYQDALALIGLPNALLYTAKDTVSNTEYGTNWELLNDSQKSNLVDKVALEYHRLLTEK